MEPALSFIAWMSVVLFQAIVQYSVVSVRTKNEIRESHEAVASGPQREHAETDDVLEFKVDQESEETNLESFDNDERNLFLQLLEQTGSEMMKVRAAMSHGV